MLALHGAGVGTGIAIGRAYVITRATPDIPDYTIATDRIDAEVKRLNKAVDCAREELLKLKRELPAATPSEVASFIDAHLLMLHDPLIADAPAKTIRAQKQNAEYALKIHADALVDVFERMEDDYLRSKKTDVAQVVNRIQKALLEEDSAASRDIDHNADGQIVVTNDLTPADAVLLKRRDIKAFITNLGGPISHTAILARSLRIPAIVGLHGAIRYIRNGELLIVDGESGVIMIAPDERVLAEYRQQKINVQRHLQILNQFRSADAVTNDGEEITLLANIELPEDINDTREVEAAGVGLYRTEFLFMNRAEPPSEEEQYEIYRHVVSELNRPVAIRTLDLGADKQVDGGRGGAQIAINPALGLRAVRLCLNDLSLFRPQLRAILRASAHGSVQIMIPMVSALDEVQQVLNLIDELKIDLSREGLDFDTQIPIGGMIEVPAAAIAADLFADKFDFLSIGTNDLIQYTLAIDRVDDAVNYLYDPLHPSVLRLIRNTIEAGQAANIPVSMCGEMAGDARYTRLLLGMGLRIFSMDPTNLLEVKRLVRESTINTLTHQASQALRSTNTDQLQRWLMDMNT